METEVKLNEYSQGYNTAVFTTGIALVIVALFMTAMDVRKAKKKKQNSLRVKDSAETLGLFFM